MDVKIETIHRVGSVALSYYKAYPFDPTEEDYRDWLDSLQDPIKTHFKERGFISCMTVLNFQRFYQESRDRGMEEYTKENLSEEEYHFWRSNGS